VLKFIH